MPGNTLVGATVLMSITLATILGFKLIGVCGVESYHHTGTVLTDSVIQSFSV